MRFIVTVTCGTSDRERVTDIELRHNQKVKYEMVIFMLQLNVLPVQDGLHVHIPTSPASLLVPTGDWTSCSVHH
jgi:hypothetical protein